MPGVLDRISKVALDLLFPPLCAVCGRAGAMVCESCADVLPRADGARCPVCWMPSRYGTCAHCQEAPPAFASIRAGFAMEGGVRLLAHRLKYDGMTALAEPMAALLTQRLDLPAADIVVPVPLHRSRERSRGYNQASLLAKALATHAGLPFEPGAARRVRATAPLAKTMRREERRAIVERAFAAREARVEGRRVVLVDDVVTTGATLDACAAALRQAGAMEVRCVTWARAD
ncbi:MAG: phosphoribosyltransferase family protein [Dehalococcoidia bacterium]